MNFRLDLNDKQIEGELIDAFGSANDLLGVESQQQITDPLWDWPQPGSDIVLDGELRDSYEQRVISPTEREHSWNARHAMANHEGARYANGSTRPPRRWTDEPVKNFKGNFEAIARVNLERIK